MGFWIASGKFERYIFEFFSIAKNLGWMPHFFFLFLNEIVSFFSYNKDKFILLIEEKNIPLYSENIIFFAQIRKTGFLFAIFIDAFKVGSLYLISILTFSFKSLKKMLKYNLSNIIPL